METALHVFAQQTVVAGIGETLNYALGGISLTLAVIAIILSTQHSRAISRVQESIQATEKQTRENLNETTKVGAQTLEALNLHEILVSNEHLSKSVNNLATDFAQVIGINDPWLSGRAYKDVDRARTYINMTAEGHLTIGPEALAADEEIPSALLSITERGDHFWASSVVSPEFWVRASAYLQLQKDRIDAGVIINRVFIFKTQEAFEDKHAQQQLRRQAEKGIHVHYVVKPKYTAQDLVAVARPQPQQGQPDEVRYAAEFDVVDGRVTGIELWSAQAGHTDRVTRAWNTLRGFFDDSKPYQPSTNESSPVSAQSLKSSPNKNPAAGAES